jgi:tRNA acetyltransferase TAN1
MLADIRSQTVCGMSVVDGDWDDLKRYNLAELYTATSKKPPTTEKEMA